MRKKFFIKFFPKNLIWGTLVLAFITTFFYFLGRLKNTFLIWIFAILYTTATNWFDEIFTQFLSDDLEKTWVYLNEFLVVTQIFRVVSMSLTGKGRNDSWSTYAMIKFWEAYLVPIKSCKTGRAWFTFYGAGIQLFYSNFHGPVVYLFSLSKREIVASCTFNQ